MWRLTSRSAGGRSLGERIRNIWPSSTPSTTRPFGARLRRSPKGRKGHQGRVERSHRTDDEEFCLPCLGGINTREEYLRSAQRWQYYLQRGAAALLYRDEREEPLGEAAGVGLGSAVRICVFSGNSAR